MRANYFALVVALLLVGFGVAPIIAGEWGSGAATTVGGKEVVDCVNPPGNKVPGEVGELVALSTSGEGSASMTTSGTVGAKWNGSLTTPACAGPVKSKTNKVTHQYTRAQGDPFTKKTFKFKVTAVLTATGSAKPLVGNPDWYWKAQASVVEKAPVLQKWVAGATAWTNALWTAEPVPGSTTGEVYNKQATGTAIDPMAQPNPANETAFTWAPGVAHNDGDTRGAATTAPDDIKVKLTWEAQSQGGTSAGLQCEVLAEALQLEVEVVSEFKS